MFNSHKKRIWVIVIVVISCSATGWSQIPPDPGGSSAMVPQTLEAVQPQAEKPEFTPYLATIIGDSVYVRSGPAQIYYDVGKLQQGQEVIVHEHVLGQNNWAKIEPTSQCFSYIAKQYVELQDNPAQPRVVTETDTVKSTPEEKTAAPKTEQPQTTEPTPGKTQTITATVSEPLLGIVTDNDIRVRAGSVKVPPANADQVQTRLDKGSIVQIIGERDDFYKIVTPKNCYFWVSLDYIKPIGAVTAAKLDELRSQSSKNVAAAPVEVPLAQAQLKRKEYLEIVRLFEAEQNKPIKQRDFETIEEKLRELISKAQSPSLKAIASGFSNQIQRVQLSLDVLKESLAQDEKLRVTMANIDKKTELIVAVNNPPGKTQEDIVVKGQLARSAVFTAANQNRRYLVLDKDGQFIYYAMADKDGPSLETWLDKKISLVGTTTYDAFGGVRILHVKKVVELPPDK
jgi:uncharacterized protein YgiM (DUF1202 family)